MTDVDNGAVIAETTAGGGEIRTYEPELDRISVEAHRDLPFASAAYEAAAQREALKSGRTHQIDERTVRGRDAIVARSSAGTITVVRRRDLRAVRAPDGGRRDDPDRDAHDRAAAGGLAAGPAEHATAPGRQGGQDEVADPYSGCMPLSAFTPQVRDWFTRAFAEPTAAQAQAWPAIATGEHALISAPTGSGKTLAAFLWALDRLVAEPTPAGEEKRTRLVYVSPLKALSYDVEKNLRAPLRGIGGDITVAIRTGDTPQKERRDMVRHPPDVLITTPESLYLMLTSQARKIFEGTEWVIVDEIHAVAQTKRGAHLAITLERLAEVADRDVQRIGLSATQNPLGGGRAASSSGRSARAR